MTGNPSRNRSGATSGTGQGTLEGIPAKTEGTPTGTVRNRRPPEWTSTPLSRGVLVQGHALNRCPSCGRALDRVTGNCRDQDDCGWCAPPVYVPVSRLEGKRWVRTARRELEAKRKARAGA